MIQRNFGTVYISRIIFFGNIKFPINRFIPEYVIYHGIGDSLDKVDTCQIFGFFQLPIDVIDLILSNQHLMIRSHAEVQIIILTIIHDSIILILKDFGRMLEDHFIGFRIDCCHFIFNGEIFEILPSFFRQDFRHIIMTSPVTFSLNQRNRIMPRLCNIDDCIFNGNRRVADNNSRMLDIRTISTTNQSIVIRICREIIYRNLMLIMNNMNTLHLDKQIVDESIQQIFQIYSKHVTVIPCISSIRSCIIHSVIYIFSSCNDFGICSPECSDTTIHSFNELIPFNRMILFILRIFNWNQILPGEVILIRILMIHSESIWNHILMENMSHISISCIRKSNLRISNIFCRERQIGELCTIHQIIEVKILSFHPNWGQHNFSIFSFVSSISHNKKLMVIRTTEGSSIGKLNLIQLCDILGDSNIVHCTSCNVIGLLIICKNFKVGLIRLI